MGKQYIPKSRRGFCIYITTFCQGPVLSVTDGEDQPCAFNTEFEAQCEIVDMMIIRLNEFLRGERDFDDAITTEEYVVPVRVLSDGSVVDDEGRHFGKKYHET